MEHIEAYLNERPIQALLFLLDIRRIPNDEDLIFLNWAAYKEIPLILIFTKTDKVSSPEKAIKKGGEIIHEVGTTRMGASPSDSVTNQYGQSWDCDNLFVMDGGVFASNPHKNCTLTIMTLAMRNASWLAGQLEKGAI